MLFSHSHFWQWWRLCEPESSSRKQVCRRQRPISARSSLQVDAHCRQHNAKASTICCLGPSGLRPSLEVAPGILGSLFCMPGAKACTVARPGPPCWRHWPREMLLPGRDCWEQQSAMVSCTSLRMSWHWRELLWAGQQTWDHRWMLHGAEQSSRWSQSCLHQHCIWRSLSESMPCLPRPSTIGQLCEWVPGLQLRILNRCFHRSSQDTPSLWHLQYWQHHSRFGERLEKICLCQLRGVLRRWQLNQRWNL